MGPWVDEVAHPAKARAVRRTTAEQMMECFMIFLLPI
jgi:hypothetical protein